MTTSAGRTKPWAALLVLCLGNFMILMDTSIVNTAAPDMMTELDTGIDKILWVLNGYLLALASLLILFGRIGDLLGPRTVFMGGLGVFTVASVLCSISQTPGQLIGARVLQGVGAAALVPQALVLISGIFPPQRRGAAFGILTAMAGLAAVSGPTLGGLIVTKLSWPWIFYINVPAGLAGIVLSLRYVPDLRTRRPRSFDLGGVLLATLALIGIVYGLVEGQRHDWGTITGPITIPGVLISSVLLLVLFVLWERRQPEPLVPLGLFRNRNFSVATVITLLTSFALYGFLLLFVLETQTLLGMSPLMSGICALPWTLALSAVAPVAGRFADRIGGRVLLGAGLMIYAAGVLGVAFIPDENSSASTFVFPLILVGVGMGTAIAPTTTEAMRSISPVQAGAASGVLNTARQVGAALGAAVIGAVLQNRLVASMHDAARENSAALPPELRDRFVDGFDAATAQGMQLGSGQQGGVAPPADLPSSLADRFTQVVDATFGSGFVSAARPTLTVVAVALIIGSLLAFLITRRPVTAAAADVHTDPAGTPKA